MKKILHSLVFLLVAMMVVGCTPAKPQELANKSVLQLAQENYLEKVDVDYSYNLAIKMEEIKSNAVLGYRTAGSEAEFLTGEMLKEEMEKIGLSNVTKDEFTLDGWTFEKA